MIIRSISKGGSSSCGCKIRGWLKFKGSDLFLGIFEEWFRCIRYRKDEKQACKVVASSVLGAFT